MVLLHSAGLDLTYWEPQIAALRSTRRVIAVDLPGHGRSPATPDDMQIDAVSDAVADAVQTVAADPVDLVGLSVGGLVAQTIAVRRPAMVRTLTLIDTGARFSDGARRSMYARAATLRQEGMDAILEGLFGHWFLEDTVRERPELIDRATKTLLYDDVAVHAALWEMIADFNGLDRLEQITAPTLVLVGEHDTSSPVAASEELQQGIAGACLSVIPNAAHLSPVERPAEVASQLLDFLTSHMTEVSA